MILSVLDVRLPKSKTLLHYYYHENISKLDDIVAGEAGAERFQY